MSLSDNPYYKYLGKEAKEHARAVEFLRGYAPTKDGMWFHPINEGKRTKFEQYLFRVMGAKDSVPDFVFLTPRKGFVGMMIEHKAAGTVLYNKDGSPRKAIKPQWEFLKKAEKVGWYTDFTVGAEDLIQQIKNYFE